MTCPWSTAQCNAGYCRLDEPANHSALPLRRILMPAYDTRSGPIGIYAALGSRNLPGLTVAMQLSALKPREDRFPFARIQLRRERNRIDSALHQATALVISA